MRSLILAMFVTALVGCAVPTGEDLSANESQEATNEDSSSSATEESLGTAVQEAVPYPCQVIYVCASSPIQLHSPVKSICDAKCPGTPTGCYKSCAQYL